jgi:hypothetical protein
MNEKIQQLKALLAQTKALCGEILDEQRRYGNGIDPHIDYIQEHIDEALIESASILPAR